MESGCYSVEELKPFSRRATRELIAAKARMFDEAYGNVQAENSDDGNDGDDGQDGRGSGAG